MNTEKNITINVDCAGLDEAKEKVNQLVEALERAQELINSLGGGIAKGLFIRDAVKKALETGGYITRDRHIFFEPTDTSDCCILRADKNHSYRRWNPSASDLLSGDWEVVTVEEFSVLSERNNLA